MAEAGSTAERVKQQADIVRVVGEYVRLKKTGKDFSGLCPFHQEKTPSFTVSPTKQIFYCFGCSKGGDVYNFVMEMEKCEFPEAVKLVAEKCSIPIPKPRPRTREEAATQHHRPDLIEIYKYAADFFRRQLNETAEGKVARAYLEDRGLDRSAIDQFGLGYAPSGGETLRRHLGEAASGGKGYGPVLLELSGLFSRDQSGRLFDRFRRRITFPISNESGKIVAFGCRALGDDQPKYLNSPETPIYSKSNLLYHLDRAKDALRRSDFAVLVEGYMDAIAVARAGISNVVASCGTSLAEPQIKLLGRFTKRVIVNYDPDAAGQAATERSISLLLEQDFEVKVLALPGKADPDKFIREQGAEAYIKVLKESPPYVDYLIARARQMDLSTAEGKLRAVNFLLPYVQKIPNRLLRSEWATRIAQQLRLDEPVLRAALSKAAAERRSEVKTQPELVPNAIKDTERRLIRMLVDAQNLRSQIVEILQRDRLYQGLETEKVFVTLIGVVLSEQPAQAMEIAALMEERDRRLLYEILFEETSELTWEEAQSCVDALRHRQAEKLLADVQRSIEANPAAPEMRDLLQRKQELMRRLAAAR